MSAQDSSSLDNSVGASSIATKSDASSSNTKSNAADGDHYGYKEVKKNSKLTRYVFGCNRPFYVFEHWVTEFETLSFTGLRGAVEAIKKRHSPTGEKPDDIVVIACKAFLERYPDERYLPWANEVSAND